ncbi:MAG: sodium-dependent transporter [Thermoplasmata archaeon]|nr:sodium-dependent transporter [Thermoplasmata archaeon]
MASEDKPTRASFSGHIGFVLASAAAAVGLGNLWRFPYLTSHYGGGIFVLVYILMAVTFGFTLLVAEVAIGRKTGKSCIRAFAELCYKYRWIGYVEMIVPILIVSYYMVIGGWVTKWFVLSVTDMSAVSSDPGYWWSYITGDIAGMSDPIIWFAVFAAVCFLCVYVGVDRGIEKVSRVLMPTLLILTGAIILYEMTLPDIWDGLVFYLDPDLSKLSAGTFLGAVSQIFYSLSIAMGIMITYGSYMRKQDNIEKAVRNISVIDTGTAILMGLMIVPVAYMFGFGDSKSMGLLFTAMPQVFQSMPGGAVIGPLFYILVLFAAVTSAVALLEAVVSQFGDWLTLRRHRAIVVSFCILIPLGLLVVFGFGPLMTDFSPFDQGAGWLGILDTLSNTIIMPLVAISTCLFVTFAIGVRSVTDEVESCGNRFRSKTLFTWMVRVICPVFLAIMLVLGLLDMYGVFTVY